MKQRGQAILMVIMILGALMAVVVIFGAKRQSDISKLVDKLDSSQAAQEAMAAAAKKVQYVYANESGCDPDILDSRLSRLAPVPAATDFGTGMSYAIAQTPMDDSARAAASKAAVAALSSDERSNHCTAASGCRQIGVPLENRVYIVTVGAVVTPTVDGTSGTHDTCARDATVRLSLAIGGNVFFQRFTLTNICTYKSCVANSTVGADLDTFDGITAVSTGASGYFTQSLACTGGSSGVPARWHGSITSSTDSQIVKDDIRWARRYLETGGGGVGETTFMYGTPSTTTSNGACAVAESNSQCVGVPCVPAFDLNRDKTNNEVDLAILENFLRGYLPSLSPNFLDPAL